MEPIKTVVSKQAKDRKPLHDLQLAATDQEILVGADRILKPTKSKEAKSKENIIETVKKDASKKVTKKNKAVQTTQEKIQIEPEDLTSDNPSENYWQILAERRRIALMDTLEENQKLVKDIEKLEEENCVYKEILDETKLFIEVLQEQIIDKNGINDSLDDSTL